MAETKRIDWIDAAKGFAILLVMMGHTLFHLRVIEVWLYTFHMPLFFFLSGYVFKIRDGESFLSFVRRKIFALVVPMLLFSIISILVNAVYYCAILHNKTMSSIGIEFRIVCSAAFGTVFWFVLVSCMLVCFGNHFLFLVSFKKQESMFSAILLLCSLVGWIWCTYMALFIAVVVGFGSDCAVFYWMRCAY